MLKKAIILLCALLSACSTQYLKTENPSAAEINAQLALAYLEKKDSVQGKAKLLLAQKQNASSPMVWYVSGYFFERTGDMTAADRAYLQAIALAPHLGAVQNNYGVFLCRRGKYREAISHFLLSIKDPDYLNVAEAYKNAGYCALKIPDRVLADEYFRLAAVRSGR